MKKIIAVGPGRCGSRNLFQLFSEWPDYVQSTHDSDPWFPKEWGKIFKDKRWADPVILDMAAQRLEALKKPRRQTVATAMMTPWRETGPWIEISAYSTPFMYGMWKNDPELEFMVMERNVVDFIASCKRLEERGLPFFIARQDYEQWKDNSIIDYGQYWTDVTEAISNQMELIGQPPIFTFNLEEYRLGSYNEELLSLFDIPTTNDNLNIVKAWSGIFDNATAKRGLEAL